MEPGGVQWRGPCYFLIRLVARMSPKPLQFRNYFIQNNFPLTLTPTSCCLVVHMCITGPCKSPAVAYETPQGDLLVIGTSPPMVQPVPIHLNCCLENHRRLDSGSASHCDHGCRYSRNFTVLSLPSFAFKVVEPNQAKWASYYFITFRCK